jgi:hypothetical protein
MPIIKFPDVRKEGNQLEKAGALIPVTISLPETLAALREGEGKPVQGPVRGMALLDTGADASAIDIGVFRHFSILAIDRVGFNSAGGRATSEVFPAWLSLPEFNIPKLEMERVIGCDFGWTGRKDDEFLMLMGRDILRNFLLVYDGIHDEWLLGH